MERLKQFYQRRKPLIIFTIAFLLLLLLGELFLQWYSLEEIFSQAPVVARTAFFFIIVIEVIIAPIPGGIIGYLGAVHFGFWHAWPILYVANVVGTIIVFFLARAIGRPFLEKSTTPKERERYNRLLSTYPWMLYLVYAVPVFPIDVISILAGVSHVPVKRFLPIAITGLVTYTGIIAFIGAFFGDYIPFVENLTFAALGLILGACVYVLWRWKQQSTTK